MVNTANQQCNQAKTLAITNRWPLTAKAYPVVFGWEQEQIIKQTKEFDKLEEHLANCPTRHKDIFRLDINLNPNVLGDCYEDEHNVQVPERHLPYFHKDQCPYIINARKAQIILKASGIPLRFRNWRIENIEQSDAKEQALAYVANFKDHKAGGKGILFAGNTGAGKTTLAVSTAIELIKKYQAKVMFVTCHDLIMLTRDFDNVSKFKTLELQEAEVLILDDLGADRLTDFGHTELTAFLDLRYREMRPLILTTNLNKSDLQEYIGQRTVSRLTECCQNIVIHGQDRREI